MPKKLTPYAKAHLRLREIDQRWKALKPKRRWDHILAHFAEKKAKAYRDSLGEFMDDFSAALKPANVRRITTTERKDMDVTVAISLIHGCEVGLNQYNELIFNQRNGLGNINLGVYTRAQLEDLCREYIPRLGIHLE